MLTEEWRDMPGFEGRYQVSDLGRVRGPSGKVLRQQSINSGYLVVTFSTPLGKKNQLMHRLVATTFVRNPDRLPEVNHDDTDKTNNRATNLEWTTRAGNVAHARARGLVPASTAMAVVGVPLAGGSPLRFDSQSAAEVALSGRQSSAIHHCLVGRKHSAYGYTWSRA